MVPLNRKKGTTIINDGEYTTVNFYSTRIVRFNDNSITLDTGSWYTMTTKNRMNQASIDYNLGFKVYQEKGEWFVNYQSTIYTFDNNDSITLHR